MADLDASARISALEKMVEEKDRQIRYLENLSEAHHNVVLMAQEERVEAEKMIQAHENIHGISRLLSEVNTEEALKSIQGGRLEFSQPISSIIENGIILDVIVLAFRNAFKSERSMVFLKENNRFTSHFYENIKPDEMNKPYFQYNISLIHNTILKKASLIVKDRETEIDGVKKHISIASIPMIFKNALIGVYYGDTIKD